MVNENLLARYLDSLLTGDRGQCRQIVEETMKTGIPANRIYMDMVWPIMLEIENLSREDRISPSQEHMATRINRTIIDQLQNKLPRKDQNNQKIVICCAENELQELGAQITADLFESDGWDVKFLGGGLTNDDILGFIHEKRPDILLIYGTEPAQAPNIRNLIDRIREVNAYPEMKIMVSGGLFNRAQGLWEEIGADMYAPNAAQAVQIAAMPEPPVKPQPTINRRKRQKTAISTN